MPTWDPDKESQGSRTERLPNGLQKVVIKKIIMGSSKGPFKTKAGDRQIGVVFTDMDEEKESMNRYAVEGKSRWTFSRLLNALNIHTKQLFEGGITDPTSFLIQAVSDEWLKHRSLWINIGENGEYQTFEIPIPQPMEKVDDDIPFDCRPTTRLSGA